jgi:hypothetical protein
LKHSDKLGQEASSQTECKPPLRKPALTLSMRSVVRGNLIRNQLGLRSIVSRSDGTILMGMCAIFSASRNLVPGAMRDDLMVI